MVNPATVADPWAAHGHQRALAEAARTARDRFFWDAYDSYGPGPEILGPLQGRRVVDIGCGTGLPLAHLVQQHGATGVGVDSSPTAAGLARHRFGHLPGLQYVTEDAVRHLAHRPGVYDVCLSRFGAACFTDPHQVLAAAAAALRPGGQLVIATMAQDADSAPAHSCPVSAPSLLPQPDGTTVTLPRWVLSSALWQSLLADNFTIQHLTRLANPHHPRRPIPSLLIRAQRR
ncbi:methyltransferase domain-containing protein [Streptomyces sp. KLMMK]|uniref:class I SAM-dependent methyltransferase n=1 Tax=Streptomyces sp. KLMMK TaxID=3109353 RepID=UPI003000BB6A